MVKKKDELTVSASGVTSSSTSATVSYNSNEHTLKFDFGLPQGPQGPQGSQGHQGPQGPQGSSGSNGSSIYVSTGDSGTHYLAGVSSTGTTSTIYMHTGITLSGTQLRASGGFYQTSDERLKIFKNDIEIDFEKLKLIPKKYFSWKDKSMGSEIYVGTSAQEVQKYYPDLVGSNKNGQLFMNYDGLNIIALKSIDLLHEKQEEINNRMEKILNKIS